MTDKHGIPLTRRKLLGDLGAIGLASDGAGLGTTAFFSDVETVEENVLTAGSLDLDVGWEKHYFSDVSQMPVFHFDPTGYGGDATDEFWGLPDPNNPLAWLQEDNIGAFLESILTTRSRRTARVPILFSTLSSADTTTDSANHRSKATMRVASRLLGSCRHSKIGRQVGRFDSHRPRMPSSVDSRYSVRISAVGRPYICPNPPKYCSTGTGSDQGADRRLGNTTLVAPNTAR